MLVAWMRPSGHLGRARHHQHPVNPLDFTAPPPRPRPTISVNYLPPVSHTQALDYLLGIKTHEGAGITYQRDDGQRGKHWRNPDMRRNPGVTGDGWQLRRFDPIDPIQRNVAICLAEGEKDASTKIGGCRPDCLHRATRCPKLAPGADFTELVDAGQGNRAPRAVVRR